MDIRLKRFRLIGETDMKLKRFYIADYQVLKDLSIDFSPYDYENLDFPLKTTYSLDFLVGKNGTGKSTVLQLLWDIMQKLAGSRAINYPFELQYELEGLTNNYQKSQIKIATIEQDPETADITFSSQPIVWKDGEKIPNIKDILPKSIVAFTTGNEETWIGNSNFNDTDYDLDSLLVNSFPERLSMEIAGHHHNNHLLNQEQEEEENPCFFISIENLSLIILCGLLVNYQYQDRSEKSPFQEVLNSTSIKAISGFSLKFRINKRTKELNNKEAKIVIAFLKLAHYIVRQEKDYLCVFDLTQQEPNIIKQILDETETNDEFNLLKALIKLKNTDQSKSVLQEVNIFLERTSDAQHSETETDIPHLHLLEWLSDGECSFLGRMCLLHLLQTTESLILLDEPEVHFNDFWKRQMVQLIDEIMQESHSHLLITTHSSITLTDVPQKDIIILKRHGNQTMTADSPTVKTFGANPSDIMVHVFGTSNLAGSYSVDFIQNQLNPSHNLDPKQRQLALEQLLSIVGQGYWSYRIERELSTLKTQ